MSKDDISIQNKSRKEKSPGKGQNFELKAKERRLGLLGINSYTKFFLILIC